MRRVKVLIKLLCLAMAAAIGAYMILTGLVYAEWYLYVVTAVIIPILAMSFFGCFKDVLKEDKTDENSE